jgi:hypothetical protein
MHQEDILSRFAILDWANGLLHLRCQSLSHIPGKGVARIMNAIFGSDRCPLHEIYFNDDSNIATMCNCQKTLELARRCGYDGKLDATKWLNGEDFANELIFWRWLRTAAVANPIPANFDFSLLPTKRAGTAAQALASEPRVELKRPRDEGVPAITSSKAVSDAPQDAYLALSSAVANFKTKEEHANTSSGSETFGQCQSCHAYIRRATAHYVAEAKRLEGLRAKIRQACEERNMELLLATLEASHAE